MGIEHLLLILFLLFSVGSALLERRKRQKQLEEAQARRKAQQEGAPDASPVEAELEEELEEEEWGGWPFPDSDPFEPKPVAKPQSPPQTEHEAVFVDEETQSQPVTVDAQRVLQELERQARVVQPKRRVSQLVGRHLSKEKGPRGPRRGRRCGRYTLTPKTARDAVVYAELLGPCKGEREEEWRW